jgi:hypothetical protein
LPNCSSLSSIRSSSPKKTPDRETDDDDEEGIGFQSCFNPDQHDGKPDGVRDGVDVLLRNAAPEKQPDQAACSNGGCIHNGSKQFSASLVVKTKRCIISLTSPRSKR